MKGLWGCPVINPKGFTDRFANFISVTPPLPRPARMQGEDRTDPPPLVQGRTAAVLFKRNSILYGEVWGGLDGGSVPISYFYFFRGLCPRWAIGPTPPFGCAQCPLTAAWHPCGPSREGRLGLLQRPHANWIAPLEKGFISLGDEGLENKNIARQWLQKPSC